MNIIQIDQNSIYLNKVKLLWRENSATLGFLPEGAFVEYALKKQILVGLTKEGEFFGYLMYRISRFKVGIVHLCIDSKYRGQGLTKTLIYELKNLTMNYQGIFLNCRQDFPANSIWPKLGFVPIGERAGKSIEGKPLCYWWYDYNHRNLFSEINEEKKVAVMDANVFFDIIQKNGENLEVNYLFTDFVQGEVKLCLAAEIYNEIYRNDNPQKRALTRNKISGFEVLNADHSEIEKIQKELNSVMATPKTPSDESDRKQLAYAVINGANFFITKDEELINQSDSVFNEFGIRILRPSTLIIYIDEMLREAEYEPIRLAGSKINIQRITSDMMEPLISNFFEPPSEKKAVFRQKIISTIATPRVNSETFIIKDEDNTSLALFTIYKSNNIEIQVPILRIKRNRFSSTLARHLIHHIVKETINYGMKMVKITDNALSKDVLNVLPLHGFIQDNNYWVKICFTGVCKQNEFIESLKNISSQLDTKLFLKIFSNESVQRSIDTFYEIENIIWPLKIYETEIPTYIVPIKDHWAMELFDEELACRSLFGVEASLALNVENAYYTGKCLHSFKPPARVLWYISENKKNLGTKSIRACSLVRETTIGKPKELYRKYQRYGIYKWSNVFELAKNDENHEIMAFQFDNTEQFRNPIKWEVIQKILLEEGITSTFQSITKITHACFLRLYTLGIKERLS